MNLETRKVSIISWITHLSDEEVLSKIESLQHNESDWWDLISKEEQLEIKQGVAELEQGETKCHDEVMSRYKKWL